MNEETPVLCTPIALWMVEWTYHSSALGRCRVRRLVGIDSRGCLPLTRVLDVMSLHFARLNYEGFLEPEDKELDESHIVSITRWAPEPDNDDTSDTIFVDGLTYG